MPRIKDATCQTLAVFLLEFLFLQWGALFTVIALAYLLIYTNFYWLTLLYTAWYVYDTNSCYTGGYSSNRLRNSRVWKHFCQYFPLQLIKTCDIDASRNYIFAMHPHGIMCLSGFGNFCTDGTGVSQLFPSLNFHVLMLKWLFFMPLTRELLMLAGGSSVSKDTFYEVLNGGLNKEKGQVCVVVVGGAEESLEARDDVYRLILKRRKGFIRMALKTGASLVPVISFGENDLFCQMENPTGSKLRAFQDRMKHWTSVGFPCWWGRGLSEKSFGWLAFRRPVYTVVGRPIEVAMCAEPGEAEVDELHAAYLKELERLFDEFKGRFGAGESSVLEFI